ncbi:hypothetical protein KAT92_05235 [Candidatus Babeliales bacterium]|nr:hypothetical protein [Candidatus Babeliales bacterium]
MSMQLHEAQVKLLQKTEKVKIIKVVYPSGRRAGRTLAELMNWQATAYYWKNKYEALNAERGWE